MNLLCCNQHFKTEYNKKETIIHDKGIVIVDLFFRCEWVLHFVVVDHSEKFLRDSDILHKNTVFSTVEDIKIKHKYCH